jgi:hypothetical protein
MTFELASAQSVIVTSTSARLPHDKQQRISKSFAIATLISGIPAQVSTTIVSKHSSENDLDDETSRISRIDSNT